MAREFPSFADLAIFLGGWKAQGSSTTSPSDLESDSAEKEILAVLKSFGGGDGFEIGDGRGWLGYWIARGWRDLDLEECDAAAESITAHKAASSRSLSSMTG